MSGGHWDGGRRLDDDSEALVRLTETNKLMQAIEHELDWGLCGDTCLNCARLRVVAALEQFFDDRCYGAAAAVAIARDDEQNLCPACQDMRILTRKKNAEAATHKRLADPAK